jgi:hypothetical protein
MGSVDMAKIWRPKVVVMNEKAAAMRNITVS